MKPTNQLIMLFVVLILIILIAGLFVGETEPLLTCEAEHYLGNYRF